MATAFAVLLDGLMLAEVDAADQLTHNDEVNALSTMDLFQRAGVRQLRPDLGRAVVGIQAHARAQAQQSLLGRWSPGRPSHLGPPTAPSRTLSELLHFSSSDAAAGRRTCRWPAAHVSAGVGEGVAVLLAAILSSTRTASGHDLGADAVALDQTQCSVSSIGGGIPALLSSQHFSVGRACPAWCPSAFIRPPALMMFWMNGGNGCGLEGLARGLVGDDAGVESPR